MSKTIRLLLVIIFITSHASTYSQLFFKKKKTQESNTGDLIVYRDDQHNDELMANGVNYFINNILPTNDTNNIREIMKARNYSPNMLLQDPIDQDGEGTISLLVVIEKCDLKTLKFFLDHGANPNLRAIHKVPNPHTGEIMGTYYSKYPLEKAASLYDTARINMLISYGANKSLVETSLKSLAYNGNISYNIDKIVFINFINALYGGLLPKDALIKMMANNRDQITPKLIADYVKKGADINANDGHTGNFGESVAWSLLMHAIQDKLPMDCIKEILAQGANVNIGSPRTGFAYSFYPLTLAVCNNDLELVKMLLDKGANLNVKGDGCDSKEATPLAIAQRRGYKNIADYLFSKGAN